ncbi:hypothetical protein CBZ_33380 [Cellulomonas biazotea]|uniref:Uncharacterized protein n=1 Tax=Cellulomonas biazotea TaxID=1709 RepID=A0A402DW21_9CELL|nr:hypothetical protein CBZ_33380 [Cellulomonas biazotea]
MAHVRTRTTRTTTSEPAFSRSSLEARHAIGWVVGVLLVLAVGAVVWHVLDVRPTGHLGVLAIGALCAGGLLLIAVGCGTITAEYVRVTTTETTETEDAVQPGARDVPTAAAAALVPQIASGMAKLSPSRSLVFAGVALLLVAGAGAGVGYTLDQVAGNAPASTPSPDPSGSLTPGPEPS